MAITAYLAGILDLDDSTRVGTLNQPELVQVIRDANIVFQRQRDETNTLLVSQQSDLRNERFRAFAVDEGQEIGVDEVPYEGSGANEWAVGYMWRRWGWRLSYNSERLQYISLAALSEEYEGKLVGNTRRHTREMMVATFDNRSYYETDEFGRVLVRPLANGDTQTYVDRFGAEQTEDFYRVTGFTAASFSAVNNPFKSAAETYDRIYGQGTTVALIAPGNVDAFTQGLAANLETEARNGITLGSGESQATPLAGTPVPGDFVGIDRATGTFVYSWDMVPTDYFLTLRLGLVAPLHRRVPTIPELVGFNLEAVETRNPFESAILRERFGYNVRNRLGLIVTQIRTTAGYVIPAQYKRDRDVVPVS